MLQGQALGSTYAKHLAAPRCLVPHPTGNKHLLGFLPGHQSRSACALMLAKAPAPPIPPALLACQGPGTISHSLGSECWSQHPPPGGSMGPAPHVCSWGVRAMTFALSRSKERRKCCVCIANRTAAYIQSKYQICTKYRIMALTITCDSLGEEGGRVNMTALHLTAQPCCSTWNDVFG